MSKKEYTQPLVVWKGEYHEYPARLVHQGEYYLEVQDQKDRMGSFSWRSIWIPEAPSDDSWVDVQELVGALFKGRVTKMGDKVNE